MSNYSTFFPTGSGGGGAVSTPGNRLNRRIFCGAGTCTWPVPTGTTSLEVHVWGGGGGGTNPTCFSGGGGGGGYVRAEYIVTDSDSLSITIGGEAGTSSITIPTQSPGSPISATGGTNTTSATGGGGGGGSVSLHPTFPQSYCMTALGGTGGDGCSQCCTAVFANSFGCPDLCVFRGTSGGGGSAGSPRGPGGKGGAGLVSLAASPGCNYAGGGGGIGHGCRGVIAGRSGGSRDEGGGGGLTNNNTQGTYTQNQPSIRRMGATRADCREDIWWKVEDIKGAGGQGLIKRCDASANNRPMAGGKGSGGAGGMITAGICCASLVLNTYAIQGARGGFLGGGGGNVYQCLDNPVTPSQTCVSVCQSGCDGKGGAAGGSGGGQSGTPGVVIIYW